MVEATAMTLRLAPDVAVHLEDDAAYVARVPEGPIHVLDQVAAIIWEEAVDADRATVAARVAERTGADPDGIAPDVDAFVGNLMALGLLTEDGEPSSANGEPSSGDGGPVSGSGGPAGA